jgi:carboxyl-terminal processing protease
MQGMQKGTKRNLFVAASYAAVLFLGIILGQLYVKDSKNTQSEAAALSEEEGSLDNNVQRALELISGNYVDSINVDSLQHIILSEMISRLDPHSDYLAPEEAARRQQALEGSFEGIGVEYFMLNDTLLTVGLVPNGPAQRAGLKVGDRFMTIDEQPVSGIKIATSELENMIRGPKGSEISVQVQREGAEELIPLTIIRDRYEISSIDAAYLLTNRTAYVKISSFGSKTVADFKRHMQTLRRQGAKDIILDLRGNGGGYLSAGIELAGLFLPQGKPIVYTQGTHDPRTVYTSREGGLYLDMGLVLLIDEVSASASEIVAGAIQDYERGTIIGRRSFGKGLIQERFGFGDGSVLNLTVARYYTPLGRSIQRQNNNTAGDTVNTKRKEFVTQSGKVLYGGGGIMPDIVVDKDTVEHNSLYQRIYQEGYLHEFVYGRLIKGAPGYSIENFLNGYQLPESDFKAFVQFVEAKGIDFPKKDESPVKQRMGLEIEAVLSRYYFGSDAYYKVKNRQDADINAALTQLEVQRAVEEIKPKS